MAVGPAQISPLIARPGLCGKTRQALSQTYCGRGIVFSAFRQTSADTNQVARWLRQVRIAAPKKFPPQLRRCPPTCRARAGNSQAPGLQISARKGGNARSVQAVLILAKLCVDSSCSTNRASFPDRSPASCCNIWTGSGKLGPDRCRGSGGSSATLNCSSWYPGPGKETLRRVAGTADMCHEPVYGGWVKRSQMSLFCIGNGRRAAWGCGRLSLRHRAPRKPRNRRGLFPSSGGDETRTRDSSSMPAEMPLPVTERAPGRYVLPVLVGLTFSRLRVFTSLLKRREFRPERPRW